MREIAQRLITAAPKVEKYYAETKNIPADTDWSSYQWDVNVLQSDEVNAFCLPGGKIAVYTGIMPVAQNADGLAVVMGHEIAHALLRHGGERMAQQKLVQLGTMAAGMSVERHGSAAAADGHGRARRRRAVRRAAAVFAQP